MAEYIDEVVRKPQRVVLTFDHAQLTANSTVKLFKVPAGKHLVVDGVDYINPTGLAENASNAFALTVQNASTVVANGIDTDSDEPGADNGIAADTFIAMTVVTASGANVLDGGEILSAVFTEDGTATLPAGRFVVHARLI